MMGHPFDFSRAKLPVPNKPSNPALSFRSRIPVPQSPFLILAFQNFLVEVEERLAALYEEEQRRKLREKKKKKFKRYCSKNSDGYSSEQSKPVRRLCRRSSWKVSDSEGDTSPKPRRKRIVKRNQDSFLEDTEAETEAELDSTFSISGQNTDTEGEASANGSFASRLLGVSKARSKFDQPRRRAVVQSDPEPETYRRFSPTAAITISRARTKFDQPRRRLAAESEPETETQSRFSPTAVITVNRAKSKFDKGRRGGNSEPEFDENQPRIHPRTFIAVSQARDKFKAPLPDRPPEHKQTCTRCARRSDPLTNLLAVTKAGSKFKAVGGPKPEIQPPVRQRKPVHPAVGVAAVSKARAKIKNSVNKATPEPPSPPPPSKPAFPQAASLATTVLVANKLSGRLAARRPPPKVEEPPPKPKQASSRKSQKGSGATKAKPDVERSQSPKTPTQEEKKHERSHKVEKNSKGSPSVGRAK